MNYFLSRLGEALKSYRRVVVATITRASGSTPRRLGAKMIVFPDSKFEFTIGGGIFESHVLQDIKNVFETEISESRTYSFNPDGQFATGAVCGGKVEVFLEIVKAASELIIVGGGHVGQALAHAASPLDFSVTLIDDRQDFSRHPNMAIKTLYLPQFDPFPVVHSDTYICLVSKGYVSDGAALKKIINSPARYIGMIGSRKKIQTVYEHLTSEGIDPQSFKRVHAPIGEDIHAESPEEIAISILAQIIKIKNAPIHE